MRFIFTLIIPALIEYLITHLFTMIDMIMLGNTAYSAHAIAAVGMTEVPLNLVIDVVSAFVIGVTAAVAWFTGAGETEKARAAARQSLVLLSLIGIAVTALALVLAEPIIRFAGARADTFADAVAYYRIVASGFFLTTATLAISSSLRGVGITKLPMIYGLLSAALNVVLNYCLIYGHFGFPELGVRGAALATTISKIPALLIALGIFFFGKTPVSFRRGDSFRLSRAILARILKIGLLAAAEEVILQTGALLGNKIIATVPTDDYAAFQIANNIEGIAWRFSLSCSVATTTATGQLLGEGRADKARAMVRAVYLLSLAMTAGIVLFFCLGGRLITSLFTTEAPVAARAAEILRITAIGMVGIGTHVPLAGALRSAGDTTTPLVASFISLWVFRVGLGYLLVIAGGHGVRAAALACALDQVVRGLIDLFRYLSGRWAKYANRKKSVSAS